MDTGVVWSISPASGAGTISASGLYTAPNELPANPPCPFPGCSLTVTATSHADASKSSSTTVTITSTESVSAVSPATPSVNLSTTQQFSATVSGSSTDTGVVWSISPASGSGTISASGLYTAPNDLPANTKVTVTATSQADPSKSSSATATIASNQSITPVSSPQGPAPSAGLSTTLQFSATVAGSSTDTVVVWSISPATGSGTISATGLYTAPTDLPANRSVTVTATSQANASVLSSTTLTLASTESVSAVTPAAPPVNLSTTQQFSATVSGSSTDTTVVWSISPASGSGTISASGLYTAPNDLLASTSVTVTATSQADPSKSSSTTATIASNESVGAISPASPTVNTSAQQQFSTTVSGSSTDTSVTWSAVSGSFSSTVAGLYTAPATVPAGGTDTVTAKSNADPSKSASTAVTITSSVLSIVVSPASPVVVGANGTVQFTATAGGAAVPVTWTAASGTFSTTVSGLYTAPASGTDTVTATSVSNNTNKTSVSVTIDGASTSTLSSLAPIVAMQNGPAFMLTVNGSGFSNGNTVLFNGKAETTSFVSSSQLTASVSSGDLTLPGTLQVTVQTGSTVTAPASFYIVPLVSRQTLTVSAGGSPSANVNLSPISPTLSLQLVGTCAGLSCSASQSGTSVSLTQANANGGEVQMIIYGSGLMPGTFFVFTGGSGDITVTQPVTGTGDGTSDFIRCGSGAVCFNINLSAVNATTGLGPRSVTAINVDGEISVFPGGLLITQ